MADKKISALTGATTPLAGTEVLPIVQSGATVQVSVANLTAGRAISATAVTASTGNFVVGTSGQGIDFSATSHPAGMTSELLADYEEGTWTPSQGAGLTVVGAFTSNGTYTKVGRLVTIRGKVDGATSIACTSAGIICGGLPYAVASDTAGVYFNGTLSAGGSVDANSTNVNAVGAIGATASIYFSATYQV